MNSSALPEFKVEGAVIHLLGAPGTGKYTIAQEMLKLCDIRLVDNHLINNPLFSLVRLDGKTPLPARIWDNVIKIWDAVADTMVHISPREFSFVLTNGLFEGDDEDRKHMLNMKRVADERGGIYIPVRLCHHRCRRTHPPHHRRQPQRPHEGNRCVRACEIRVA
ncbi:MAG: hypothetical protein PSY14_15760 [bacterium]|nr:hypothetical protein [bacterium]